MFSPNRGFCLEAWSRQNSRSTIWINGVNICEVSNSKVLRTRELAQIICSSGGLGVKIILMYKYNQKVLLLLTSLFDSKTSVLDIHFNLPINKIQIQKYSIIKWDTFFNCAKFPHFTLWDYKSTIINIIWFVGKIYMDLHSQDHNATRLSSLVYLHPYINVDFSLLGSFATFSWT